MCTGCRGFRTKQPFGLEGGRMCSCGGSTHVFEGHVQKGTGLLMFRPFCHDADSNRRRLGFLPPSISRLGISVQPPLFRVLSSCARV